MRTLWIVPCAAITVLALAGAAGALSAPRTTSCCQPGADCCFPGSPCCEAAAAPTVTRTEARTDCCPDGPCCQGARTATLKVSCCPDGPCCPDGSCCAAATAGKAKARTCCAK